MRKKQKNACLPHRKNRLNLQNMLWRRECQLWREQQILTMVTAAGGCVLRDFYKKNANYVSESGVTSFYGAAVDKLDFGVRPAMWINITAS